MTLLVDWVIILVSILKSFYMTQQSFRTWHQTNATSFYSTHQTNIMFTTQSDFSDEDPSEIF